MSRLPEEMIPRYGERAGKRRRNGWAREAGDRRWLCNAKRNAAIAVVSSVAHSRAFQCRIPASTCIRRSSSRPAHVARCNSPGRCAPNVCPVHPDPPRFSSGRSERDFQEPESIGKSRYIVRPCAAYRSSADLQKRSATFLYIASRIFPRDFIFTSPDMPGLQSARISKTLTVVHQSCVLEFLTEITVDRA